MVPTDDTPVVVMSVTLELAVVLVAVTATSPVPLVAPVVKPEANVPV